MGHPDPSLHTTFLNIEPYSGVAFQAHKRIQVSFPMEAVRQISVLQQVPKLVFPVMWYDEGADITEDWRRYFYRLVEVPLLVVDLVTGLAISAAILSLGLVTLN